MHPSLSSNQFFVKEHTGIFKAANQYDIFDPTSQQKVLECREPHLGFITKLFRFTDYKRMTPFDVRIQTPEGQQVLRVRRGLSLLLSKVEVLDENDQIVGYFKQKLFSIGGKFDVLNAQEEVLCTLQGHWASWDFRFMQGQTELANVSKKWAGIGKELFTSADNYILTLQETLPAQAPLRPLILGAVMCIDMVLKE